MGQSSLRWTVRALHDRMSLPNGQKRANAGAKARTNQKLPTFPTSSALQTTKGDFHSVSPGIAAEWPMKAMRTVAKEIMVERGRQLAGMTDAMNRFVAAVLS
jgi:hypothetical protein